MAASFLIPLLFSVKMGALLLGLRSQIKTLEKMRMDRADG